jgi:hypothetical protein
LDGEPRGKRAGEVDRRRGEVDQDRAGLHRGKQPLADLGQLRPARQRQEHHGRVPRRILRRAACLEPLLSQAGERLLAQIEALHAAAGLAQQVGADRLAHDAEPDAAEHHLFAQRSPPVGVCPRSC